MEFIYYTIAAIVLYGVSDYILNTIEIKLGRRLANRSLIFLVIIMVLSVVSFSVLQSILKKPALNETINKTQFKQIDTIPDASGSSNNDSEKSKARN